MFDDKGGMLPAGYPNRKADNLSIHSNIMNSTCPICTYAAQVPIKSCQTKMISQQWCGQIPDIAKLPNKKEKIQKILRNKQLIFGLTEEFNASLQLFHKQLFPSATVINPMIPTNQIRKNPRHNNKTHQRLATQLFHHDWTETYDTLLYETAKEIFCTKCKQYNIQTLTCDT